MSTDFIRKGTVVNGYTIKEGITRGPLITKEAAKCVGKGHEWRAVRKGNVQTGISCARCQASAS